MNTEDIRGLYARRLPVEEFTRDLKTSFGSVRGTKVRMAFDFSPDEPWQLPLADLMYHVINHSSYHRGQVITLLRQLGHEPPATDFLEFLKETAQP